MNKVISFVFSIAFIIILLGAVTFVADKYKDGVNVGGFTLTYNDVVIADKSTLVLPFGEVAEFKTKGLQSKRTVKIERKIDIENDFAFEVDAQPYRFSQERDLTQCFALSAIDNGFAINNNRDFLQLLQVRYSKKVIDMPLFDFENLAFFTVKIMLDDGTSIFSFDIKSNYNYRIQSIEFDEKELII